MSYKFIKNFNISDLRHICFFKDEVWGIVTGIDDNFSTIHVFDTEGILIKKKKVNGISFPKGMCVVEDTIWIANWIDGKIFVFDKEINLIKTIKHQSISEIHILILVKDKVWILNGKNQGNFILNSNGEIVNSINHNFVMIDFACSVRDEVWIIKGLTLKDNEIYVFDLDGNFKKTIKIKNKFEVNCIVFDGEYTFMTYKNSPKIYIYNYENKIIGKFRNNSVGEGHYICLNKICIVHDDLWVYDFGSNRICIYKNELAYPPK